MMIDAYNDNTKCRTHFTRKKMEEDEGLRTVECLRGRLLAERQASRTAKEEAELMSKKIAELEAHLKEEIKLRGKAEKRLRFLMKKLESFKGSRKMEGSERSSSSEVSAVSCVSSTGTSASKEEDQEAKTQITNSEKTHDRDLLGEDIKLDQVTAKLSSVEDNSSLKPEDLSSGKASVASTTSHEERKTGYSSPTTTTSSRGKMMQSTGTDQERDKDDENEDGNAWALVPVEIPFPKRDNKEAEIEDKSVVEVLDALRHAREKAQRSLREKRACDHKDRLWDNTSFIDQVS